MASPRRVAVLLALLALAVAAATPAPAAAAGPRYLTALTWNIARASFTGSDLTRIAALIRSAHPDVVALQEVDWSWSRSGSVDQAAELGRLLGMRHYFDSNLDCASRDEDGDGFCQYGTAILTRHPFVAGSGRQYALPSSVGQEPRGLARLAINVGGRTVDVFNTHLVPYEPTRVRQVASIRAKVEHDPRPFVLAGDFNALPFQLEMVGLRRVTRDAAIAAGQPHLRTTALGHPVRLDYLMLPRPPFNGPAPRVEALEARVIGLPRLSDHRPLIARLRIPAS